MWCAYIHGSHSKCVGTSFEQTWTETEIVPNKSNGSGSEVQIPTLVFQSFSWISVLDEPPQWTGGFPTFVIIPQMTTSKIIVKRLKILRGVWQILKDSPVQDLHSGYCTYAKDAIWREYIDVKQLLSSNISSYFPSVTHKVKDVFSTGQFTDQDTIAEQVFFIN